jgi:ribosomal protein S18 acetylase RimI-like enzyme
MSAEPVSLVPFSPPQLPALVAFLNQVLAGHRHWAAITEADFTERVLSQPSFDPHGLILAWRAGRLVGGVHAIKPPPPTPIYQEYPAGHHIAWLATDPAFRGQRVGQRLLAAAENYLYYCPVYFAGQDAPFYGIIERLWAPWYGSTERMGVSALHDQELVEWLGRRGYQVANPGDVSMAAALQDRKYPDDPGLADYGLCLTPIDENQPWTDDEAYYRLRGWGANGGRHYEGLVIADTCNPEHNAPRAVGSIAWYPLPDGHTAALAWIGLERRLRGLRFGSYLLDRALVEMARCGYRDVEVHVHTKDNPEAFALFRRRGFAVIDYWVNLVKT